MGPTDPIRSKDHRVRNLRGSEDARLGLSGTNLLYAPPLCGPCVFGDTKCPVVIIVGVAVVPIIDHEACANCGLKPLTPKAMPVGLGKVCN